jgi:non-specific serine/threonine protein kinase
MLDRSARAAYQQRLEDLRDELEEAERFNDPARALRARREIDFLGEELARAVGLGGRDRRAAAAAERARVNVTRTIAAVLKRIAAVSPTLGQHLAATISTGYFCSYTPDPRVPIVWSF